jgi:hypothetical protein
MTCVVVIANASKAIQKSRGGAVWIASAFAQERFGGLLSGEARAASVDGSLALAMTMDFGK